jgi:hypothetical protein
MSDMREILFRGKCVDTGNWYEGQYIHLHKTTYCVAGSPQRDAESYGIIREEDNQ